MFAGKDIDPFNTFTLHCTASKPSNIIPSLQVSWYHNDLQLDNSVQGVDISEEEVNNGVEKTSALTVSSARALNSGAYKCRVAISIPESDEVAADQTAIVSITGTTYLDVQFITLFPAFPLPHSKRVRSGIRMGLFNSCCMAFN